MLSDWELWAVANKLVEQHGDAAASRASSRIAELAAAGDRTGVTVWEAISTRIDRLGAAPPDRFDS